MISNTFSSRPTAALGSNRSGSTSRAVPCRRPTIGGKLSTSTSTSTSKASSSVRSPSLSSSPAARAVAPPRALSRPFDPPSAPVTADSDPELLEVLEMCDDAELESVWGLLTGISPLSPLVKSIAVASSPSPPPSPSRPGGRAALAAAIDARFRFLAADAGATLGGRRPSYRDTLLRLRDRLGVRCPGGLRTAELEAEILMHSLGDAGGSGDGLVSVGGSSAPRGSAPSSAAATVAATPAPVQHAASAPRQRARRAAASSSSSPLSSGGSGGVFASAAAALGAAAALEAARGTALRSLGAAAVGKRAAHEAALRALVARAGARGAASVSSAVAVRGAARSAAAAAARYSGARVALSALSAASWAFLAADLGLRAVGTDWSRVEGAVLALAQVRLLRTYGFVSCEPDASDLGSYGGGGGGGVGPAFFSPPLTLPPAAEDMSRSPSRPAAAEA